MKTIILTPLLSLINPGYNRKEHACFARIRFKSYPSYNM